jgi:hypothetical protein
MDQSAVYFSLMSEPIDPATLIATLNALEQRIPELRALTNAEIITLRKAASLNPDWVVHAVGTLGASDTIERAVGSTYDELLAEIDEANRWYAAETRLYALYKGVATANLIRRHRIGVKALQIYGISRQLIRRPEHNHLISRVETLRQMNKLGRRKKKT